MTYTPGMGPRAAAMLGVEPGEPRITCDGCGIVRHVLGARATAVAPAWFMDGKAPPGWRLEKDGDARRDHCPRCKDAAKARKR